MVLLDSGADINCISKSYYSRHKVAIDAVSSIMSPNYTNTDAKEITISTPAGKLQWHAKVVISLQVGSKEMNIVMFVVDKLPSDILLGNPTMREQGIDLINTRNHAKVTLKSGHHIIIPYHSKVAGKKQVTTMSIDNEEVIKLHAIESIEIPSGCETMMTSRCSKHINSLSPKTMLIGSNPCYNNASIRVAYGIHEMDSHNVDVVIANLGMEPKTIHKGDVIALAKPIALDDYIIHSLDEQGNNYINTINKVINSDQYQIDVERCRNDKEYFKGVLKRYELPDINVGLTEVSSTELIELFEMLKSYSDIFAKDPDRVGHVDKDIVTHSIDTGDARPISQGPRRVSPAQRIIIKETIDRLLEAGIIKPSRSPWSSPVLLVPKISNPITATDWRMCIDYRKLNEVTKKEIYAIPRTEDAIDALNGAKWFTTIDLASGYFQIALDEKSQEKTAFVTYDGQYEYTRMSFGLVNAPSTFQRCMDTVLAGLKWKCVQIYLDDAIIASSNFKQHLKDVSEVFTRFKEAGFKLKAKKCYFCCTEVQYLGHLITREGVRADPEKIELIKNWPIPKEASNLHSFVGLAGYYRKLIQNFAQREAPLRKLLSRYLNVDSNKYKNKKVTISASKNNINSNNNSNNEFIMNKEEIDAFNDLKEALIANPILALPDFSGNSKFELHTDASDQGISAILVQITPKGVEQVIHYGSRMLTKAELKWHTQEKEALAIVWGCNKFRSYLLGSHFTIRSDHQSLQWLMNSEKGRLARWALSLSEFDYTIVHRAGIKNVNADVASRWTRAKADEHWDPMPYYAFADSIITDLNNIFLGVVQSDKIEFTQDNKYDLLTAVLKSQVDYVKFREAISLIVADTPQEAHLALPKGFADGKTLLIINQNMLCRKITDSKGTVLTQILIPPDDRVVQNKIMSTYHDGLMAGHFGVTRTLNQILRQYYWPSIRKDVKEYVLSCALCQAHKSSKPKRFASELNPSLPEGPNYRLSVDLIGPLPLTEAGYHYAIVMVDYFTKYVVVAPLTSKEGGEVAEAIFKNWYAIYGIPYELQTDQGNEFTNDLLKRLNYRIEVGHRVTTPYYPQANGQVERFNQTLKNCIAIYAEDKPGTWSEFLGSVSWAYNSSLHPITGFSPYYLMFGRIPRLPMDVFQGNAKDVKFDLDQYQTKLTVHMRDAYMIVKANLEKYAIKNKIVYDSKVQKHLELKKGDKVLLYKPKINRDKNMQAHSQVWIRDWIGPYTIVGQKYKNKTDVYIVKDEVTGREWTVNIHSLRPFNERPYLNSDRLTELKDSSRDASSWEVAQDLVITTRDAEKGVMSNLEDAPSADRDNNLVPELNVKGIRSKGRVVSKQETKRSYERALDQITDQEAQNELKEYELDKILTHKKSRRGLEYKVLWVGYKEPSYINADQIMTEDIIKEYWSTIPVKERPVRYRKLGLKKNLESKV